MRDIFRQSKMWHTPSKLKDNYEVVIIGGGSHGLATAYYLTKHPVSYTHLTLPTT